VGLLAPVRPMMFDIGYSLGEIEARLEQWEQDQLFPAAASIVEDDANKAHVRLNPDVCECRFVTLSLHE
jgi:hypothetical protein